MRIDPKNLGKKRKETKSNILEALKKNGISPIEPFDVIERSSGVWDIVIEKERFAIEIER